MKNMELLAPAGGKPQLEAALEAGANAVYFGLKKLNARAGAQNFAPEELAEIVSEVHRRGAKAYLTLNIDLAERDLGLAARTLDLAESCGVDAVLVRDAALLLFRPFFPKLSFHFSTQAAVSSSAGVEAADSLGISRVVLARELNRDEIAACCGIGDVEIEVFVQGAMCFSSSGRCYLSSWVGGRSGNRGCCASPCRVKWENESGEVGNPLSMHDLCLAQHIGALGTLGVASLKIEGRLKSAAWVSRAVELYRLALDGKLTDENLANASLELGGYAGRQMSDAFYQGTLGGLTGEGARVARPETSQETSSTEGANESVNSLSIIDDPAGGTLFNFTYQAETAQFRIPPQRIANPRRATSIVELAETLKSTLGSEDSDLEISIDPAIEDLLLPRNACNRLADQLTAFVRQSSKSSDGRVRDIALPSEVKQLLDQRKHPGCPENAKTLGMRSTLFRVSLQQAGKLIEKGPDFLARRKLIIDPKLCASSDVTGLVKSIRELGDVVHAVALPAVMYEADLKPVQAFLAELSGEIVFEVNSWDTWQLAKKANAKMIAGPGMAILNSLAAKQLQQLGFAANWISPEIDQGQLEELCSRAQSPLYLTVYANTPLMQTRVEMPSGYGENHILSDGRNVRLRPVREGSVTVFRSCVPLDWTKLKNPKVRVAQLVVDLTGSDTIDPRPTSTSLFNYDRRLR